MDYEKKYKEALKKARIYRDNARIVEDYAAAARYENIFPELRESEDERIRKELIEFIKWSVDRHFMREDFHQAKRPSEWIAYLEKQKEQKPELYYDKELDIAAREFYLSGGANSPVDSTGLVPIVRMAEFGATWMKERTQKDQKPNFDTHWENGSMVCEQKEEKAEWKPQPESLEALMYAIEGKWEMIKPTSYLSRRLRDLYEGLVNTYNVDETLLAELPKTAYTAKDIEELRALKDKIDASMDEKPAEWSEDWREEDIQTRFAFYTYKDDPSVLYLSNVFVEETSRNHGFGTRILRAAEKVAETIGATTISLKVKQDSPANAWYRKNGYGYVAFEDGYDWLEKNLEYMKPQPKREWNEEDENTINLMIAILRENHPNGLFKTNPVNTTCMSAISTDMLIKRIESLRPQPHKEIYQAAKHDLAIKFMNYLDENRPDGKMGLSNGECEDIDKAFKENDWAKIMMYYEKYRLSWKPSEEQMSMLLAVIRDPNNAGSESCSLALKSIYEQLKKLI